MVRLCALCSMWLYDRPNPEKGLVDGAVSNRVWKNSLIETIKTGESSARHFLSVGFQSFESTALS